MKKILMIDDDEELCHEMCEILSFEGYQADFVHCGESGLKKALHDSYAVVLLDLKMTGMGGRKVLEELKAKRPEIKIIVLTGSPLNPAIFEESSESDGSLFNGSGVNDNEVLKLADFVMNKPFEIAGVLSKLKEFFRP